VGRTEAIHQQAVWYLRHKHADEAAGLRRANRLGLVRRNPAAWIAVLTGFVLGGVTGWVVLDAAGYMLIVLPLFSSHGLLSVALCILLALLFIFTFRTLVRLLKNTAF
jgi:hypothetical protein